MKPLEEEEELARRLRELPHAGNEKDTQIAPRTVAAMDFLPSGFAGANLLYGHVSFCQHKPPVAGRGPQFPRAQSITEWAGRFGAESLRIRKSFTGPVTGR